MTSGAFDAGDWMERVATALCALSRAQEPFLHAYWQHNPREQLIVDGRDETPFPLDDLRMVYAEARYSQRFGREAEYAPLRALLDPVRHALLSHPTLERAAVSGRPVGENDFWLRMVNSGTSISAGDLIAGLIARAAERSGDGFRAAVRELNAFLWPAGDEEAGGVLGELDEGCDAVLFYGLTVSERIDIEDGMAILPFGEVRRFVDRELVEEVAPRGAGFHGWRSVGAVVRPFRWRPAFRRRGSVNEPIPYPPVPFFSGARPFVDLLSVSHATPVLPLATISDCIDQSAARLFGVGSRGSGMYQKWAADGLDGFDECPVLSPTALDEAREAFRNRETARFENLAPMVSRLAEALGRHGRFSDEVRTVDVAIALEAMYELPKWRKSQRLANRAAGFLGTCAEDRKRVREGALRFYEARSEIVHSGPERAAPFRKGAAFVTGFDLARRTLFKLLHEGVPEDWNALEVADG